MPGYKLDPIANGREDCDDAVANGADAAAMAKAPLGADEALINAMNRTWVLDAAGADMMADADEEWERVGVPWCAAYNEAFRARAEEIATINAANPHTPEHAMYTSSNAYVTIDTDNAIIRFYASRAKADGLTPHAIGQLRYDLTTVATACSSLASCTFRVEVV